MDQPDQGRARERPGAGDEDDRPEGVAPDDRRTIYGHDAYRRALQEPALTQMGVRVADPPAQLRPYLPASHKDSRFLYQPREGTLWEDSREAPHHEPLLTGMTLYEARELYGEGAP